MTRENDNGKKLIFKDELTRRILSGELKPGTRLPAERELAETYGISRGSVNQGILDLERAGFLTVVARKGTFVADYVHASTPETVTAVMGFNSGSMDKSLFADFMSLRSLIERESVRLACTRRTKAHLAQLTADASALFSCTPREFPAALYAFHLSLVTASGNAAYVMVYRSFEVMLRAMMEKHYSSSVEYDRDLPLYSELSVAIIYGDAAKADRLLLQIFSTASAYLERA